jgi:hypothetical protein
MFCPNCGTKNDVQQSFCRSCGMELKDVLQSLSKIEGFKIANTEWLKKLGIFTIGGFAGLIICLFLVLVFSSIRLDLGSALVVTMILFGITLGVLTVNLFNNFELKNLLKSKSKRENLPGPLQFERLHTNKQLNESSFEPIPSITESTTELIYMEKIKPKTSGELG